MRVFLRKTGVGREPLAVAMIAVRTGERVLQIGVDDPSIAAMLAAKTGISGRAAIVVSDERAAARARKAAERAAALIETHVAPLEALPFEPDAFDVIVIHDMARRLATLVNAARIGALRECHRVLRSGGRAVVIEPGAPVGLRVLLNPRQEAPSDSGSSGTTRALRDAGFSLARVLADREGHRFVEGLKN